MVILAIDTSSRESSLAILENQTVLAQVGGFSDQPYASRLFADLQSVLATARVTLEGVELFAVCAGPGSFTGLRVGLTAVKGWAEAFSRPVAAVSGLEAVAAQAPAASGLLAAVIDARGGQVFGGTFRHTGGEVKALAEEVVLPPRELVAWVGRQADNESPLFLSPTIEAIQPALANSQLVGWKLQAVSGTLAPFIGRLGYAHARRGDLVDPLHLDANYIRRSDAEVNWKRR
jgi:tRNA threonylcarbamoyladenosine biosynthesis protein TsaB